MVSHIVTAALICFKISEPCVNCI